MRSTLLSALLLLWNASDVLALPSVERQLSQHKIRASVPAYYDPRDRNGSMLTLVNNTYPAGLGEPLNIILSGQSDQDALPGGRYWLYWTASIGFSYTCFGQQDTSPQRANLGDGHGPLNQTNLMRWNYGDFNFGTCKETVNGGNHFRYWVQNGDGANSGAVFMAASVEKNLAAEHDIEPDGYDNGRDQVVGNATQPGGTTFRGVSFSATAENVTGLLSNGSKGINHYLSIDGVVSLLTIKVTNVTENWESSGASSRLFIPTSTAWTLLMLLSPLLWVLP